MTNFESCHHNGRQYWFAIACRSLNWRESHFIFAEPKTHLPNFKNKITSIFCGQNWKKSAIQIRSTEEKNDPFKCQPKILISNTFSIYTMELKMCLSSSPNGPVHGYMFTVDWTLWPNEIPVCIPREENDNENGGSKRKNKRNGKDIQIDWVGDLQ